MVTIAPMRTSFGTNRYAGLGEDDFMCYTARGSGPVKPTLIICHPHLSSALGMFADPSWVRLYQDLAEYYNVSVSDLGGGLTWGAGNAGIAIDGIRTQFTNYFGSGPTMIGLLGISMGGLAAFNYAHSNPFSVNFVCGISPALSLNDLKSVDGGAYASEINTAYGGAYTDGLYGDIASPHYYRADYPAATVRTGIWYSPDDDITRPQWPEAMQVAKPEIELYKIRNSSGVGPEHEDSVPPAIEGLSSGTYQFPKPADWCNQRRFDMSF